jgi:hypothetical protein
VRRRTRARARHPRFAAASGQASVEQRARKRRSLSGLPGRLDEGADLELGLSIAGWCHPARAWWLQPTRTDSTGTMIRRVRDVARIGRSGRSGPPPTSVCECRRAGPGWIGCGTTPEDSPADLGPGGDVEQVRPRSVARTGAAR